METAGCADDLPILIAGGGIGGLAAAYAPSLKGFYHARGVTSEPRNILLGDRTPEQAYDGIAWLYGDG